MTPGKSASQAGHAFLDSFATAEPDIGRSYLDSGGTKIVLQAPDLLALECVYTAAKTAGLPCAKVVESGHVMLPAFNGDPIVTAIGIGPVERDRARPLLKRFRLMP